MSIEPHAPEPNDDPDFDNEELIEASEETANSEDLAAPETVGGTEELIAWDEVPEEAGHKAPTTPLEDEVNPSETLVTEGIEEADREQRMAAADPDLLDE